MSRLGPGARSVFIALKGRFLRRIRVCSLWLRALPYVALQPTDPNYQACLSQRVGLRF